MFNYFRFKFNPMQNEVSIEIISATFRKKGVLEFTGSVNLQYFDCEVDGGDPAFEQLLPVMDAEFEYVDEDDLMNATLDDWFSLHWHVKVGGHVLSRVVRLEKFMEEMLYQKYINQ